MNSLRSEASGDNTLLSLNEDEKAVSLKSLSDMRHALAFFQEMLSKDEATVGIRHNTLSVVRSELTHIGKFIGSDKDEENERKSLIQRIKDLNLEKEELRKELGQGVTAHAITSKLKLINSLVGEWWSQLGFGTIKGEFANYWINMQPMLAWHGTLSVYLSEYCGSFEEKPVTTKANKKQRIIDLQKELDLSEGDMPDKYVLENEKNRIWFVKEIQSRFPNAVINEWKSTSFYRSNGRFQIREIEVYIPISDIEEI